MHIPTSTTQNIRILTFNDALANSFESKEYDTGKWIYVPNFYTEYRYILGTCGKKPLVTIGINPSTAAPDNLDNTLKSVSRIAAGNGFDSFIMFNVYAQRATNPDDMDKEFNNELHNENMEAFRYVLKLSEDTPSIWAAWGTIIEKRTYLKRCLEDMIDIGKQYNAKWYIAGNTSIKGHPHHPLYLKKDTLLRDFDIKEYVKNCLTSG